MPGPTSHGLSWVPRPGLTLVKLVTDAGPAPVIASVVGAGGTGKSRILAHLHAVVTGAGRVVHRGLHDGPPPADPAAVWLVDDAHQLDTDGIDRIRTVVEEGRTSVIVALRPSPPSEASFRLAFQRDDLGIRVALGPYDHDDVAGIIKWIAPHVVAVDCVEEVLQATSGMPWLVHPTVAALGASGHPSDLSTTDLIDLVARRLPESDADLSHLLLGMAVGFDATMPPPGLTPARADVLLEEAFAAGVLRPDGTLVAAVGRAILESTPPHRLRAMQRDLLDATDATGLLSAELALGLSRTGLRDARLSGALERAADELLATEPERALELYGAAVSAGGSPRQTAARRAQAEAAIGDLDAAGRLLDELLAKPDPPDADLAVDTLAAVWAQRGMLARSAAIYQAARHDAEGRQVLAAISLLGVGQPASAREAVESRAADGTSLFAVALDFLCDGLFESVDGTGDRALSHLVRSADAMTSSRVTHPLADSPAALASLVALHCGQPAAAESILRAALEGGQCGAAARQRLLLLRGWVAMLDDRFDDAIAAIAEVSACDSLAARDEFVLGALRVGVARRLDDAPALAAAWQFARETLVHVPVDLYSLLPLGELVVAAARVRESARVEAHLADAWALLARLGSPPLWSLMLHWSCVQAAILSNSPHDLAPHAEALVRAAPENRMAAALANAARAWRFVLGGAVDVEQVEAAARGLAAIGLQWDGARLAGHAAGRTEHRPDMIRLLSFARELRSSVSTDAAAPAPRANGKASSDERSLSEREMEVARLVLQGKTYREIGAAIFVSPRTAEHHIARIRRRLGATTRSELHARLRDALEGDNP